MFRFSGRNLAARQELLEGLSLSQVKLFIELAKNSLYGIIPLSSEQKTALSSIKSLIRTLVSERLSIREKKQALIHDHRAAYKLVTVLYQIIQELLWER